jgi:predicted dehydrogenase
MRTTRREFSRTATTVAAVTALSASRVLGANERVRMGWIGVGGRGSQLLSNFLTYSDVEVPVVCDVYDPFRAAGVEHTEGRATAEKDFRRVLDNNDIDAVVVAAPDHWHALMTVMACRAGKDVYVEKPLTLMAGEGRAMIAAARGNDRIVQTGSQQRSAPHYQEAVQLVREGGLGQVHEIKAGYQRNAVPGFEPRALEDGLTSELDWDLWLGPAPEIPFDPFRCIYNFRWFWNYSGGQMTNWGAHHLDIARWMLGDRSPMAVSGAGGRYALTDGGETPDLQEVLYRYSDAVVTWTGREFSEGDAFQLKVYGDGGMMSIDRNGYEIRPEGQDVEDVIRAEAPVPDATALHARNFLDSVKSRSLPIADVEEGHKTALLCHLGNIATRMNRTIEWDQANETIRGDPEASQWLMKPYRAPWRLEG